MSSFRNVISRLHLSKSTRRGGSSLSSPLRVGLQSRGLSAASESGFQFQTVFKKENTPYFALTVGKCLKCGDKLFDYYNKQTKTMNE